MSNIENGGFPELLDDQDQVVIRLDLRRKDPENPQGDAVPDIGSAMGEPNPVLFNHLLNICGALGFDPDVSYVAITSVRDVEGSTGVVSLSQLVQLGEDGDPEPVEELPQPEPETPVEEPVEEPSEGIDPPEQPTAPETETEEPPVNPAP